MESTNEVLKIAINKYKFYLERKVTFERQLNCICDYTYVLIHIMQETYSMIFFFYLVIVDFLVELC